MANNVKIYNMYSVVDTVLNAVRNSWNSAVLMPPFHLCASGQDASTIIGVIHKLDRRQVLLKTPPTSRGEIFKILSLGAKFKREVPSFLRYWYQNFLTTRCSIGGRKFPCQNRLNSFSSCDWRADWRTPAPGHCLYRASIASRGKMVGGMFGGKCPFAVSRVHAACVQCRGRHASCCWTGEGNEPVIVESSDATSPQSYSTSSMLTTSVRVRLSHGLGNQR